MHWILFIKWIGSQFAIFIIEYEIELNLQRSAIGTDVVDSDNPTVIVPSGQIRNRLRQAIVCEVNIVNYKHLIFVNFFIDYFDFDCPNIKLTRSIFNINNRNQNKIGIVI